MRPALTRSSASSIFEASASSLSRAAMVAASIWPGMVTTLTIRTLVRVSPAMNSAATTREMTIAEEIANASHAPDSC
jgi:hypothetical protein